MEIQIPFCVLYASSNLTSSAITERGVTNFVQNRTTGDSWYRLSAASGRALAENRRKRNRRRESAHELYGGFIRRGLEGVTPDS